MKEFEVPDTRPLVVKAKENKKTGLELPLTLGKPMPNSKEYEECMAMDSCIKNVFTGFRTDTMFSTMPMFVGYGMLSNVSQEALIRAGVETVADEMTRKFIRWTYHTDDGKENKEDLISKMDEQTKKYKLKEIFNEAMLKDGYFGGCLVYIDMGDLDDEEKEEPLILDKKTFKAGSFRGFKVIEPINIYPGWYNTNDPTDEYYFKPKYWYILGKKYHESRFLYFAGNEAPLLLKPTYNFFGIPQAQLALDYVAHFVANREAAQELLNKFSLTCWKTNMTQALKGRGCNDLVSRVRMFNRMKNNNGTMVLDKETEDMLQINTPLSGVRDIVEMSLNLLTAVWRIPKIKYLGEGEGGLNASSKEQMRSFYDYITSQQEKEFTHPLEIVSKIFQLNLGLDINEALSFEFPPLVEMDDKERADLNKEQADRDAIYLANGVLSQEEVRKRLSLDKHSEYSMIDVDDMPEQPEAQPLGNVDKEEQEEEVKVANDGLVMDEFKESDHPRDKGGRFIEKLKDLFSKKKIKTNEIYDIENKDLKNFFNKKNDWKFVESNQSAYNPSTKEILLSKDIPLEKRTLVHEKAHAIDIENGHLSEGIQKIAENEMLETEWLKDAFEKNKNKIIDFSDYDGIDDFYDYNKKEVKPEALAYYAISKDLDNSNMKNNFIIKDIFSFIFKMTNIRGKNNPHGIDYISMGSYYWDSEIFANLAVLLETDKENYNLLKRKLPKTIKRFEEIIKS